MELLAEADHARAAARLIAGATSSGIRPRRPHGA
jgi:hypothetical protein